MSEQQQEMLSALHDGQSSDFELRRVLDQVDDDALQRLRRYQLIGDAVRKQLDERYCTLDVSAQVSAMLANEAPPKKTASRFSAKPVIGFAAAASVAFVTVFSVQQLRPVDGVPGIQGSFVADGDVSASQLPISASDLGLSTVSGTSTTLLERSSKAEADQHAVEPDRFRYFMEVQTKSSELQDKPQQPLVIPAARQ